MRPGRVGTVVWWVVAGVPVVALLVLLMVAGALGERLRELQRVADLAAERSMHHQHRLRARAALLQPAVIGVRHRRELTERLLVRLRPPDVR
jgi:uncharacterized membrane protein